MSYRTKIILAAGIPLALFFMQAVFVLQDQAKTATRILRSHGGFMNETSPAFSQGATEQAATLEEISNTTTETSIDKVTQQNSAPAERSANAAEELLAQATELRQKRQTRHRLLCLVCPKRRGSEGARRNWYRSTTWFMKS